MATALIYLAPGAFRNGLAESPALYQESPADPVSEGSLSQALEALRGGGARIVIGGADALCTHVNLSRKQARHLQRVLPFLLEEQLLDAPERLWFAAGKGDHGRYPVTVVDREALDALLTLARDAQVHISSLKSLGDVLSRAAPVAVAIPGCQTLVLDRERALSYADEAQLSSLMALCTAPDGEDITAAAEPAPNDPEQPLARVDSPTALFQQLRDGINEAGMVEILQGALAPRQNRRGAPSPWAPWKPVLGLAAAVFVLSLVALGVQTWRYERAADQAFADAGKLYQSLFPGDRATAGLRRQFEARLARLSNGGGATGNARLFQVLPSVAAVLSASKVEPKRLQFDERQGNLLLDLGAKEYADLEKLQTALREKGVNASIANYRNGPNGVTARIRVEQAG
ncbi:type II secretion system protein GspL [Alcanivorax sp. 24]|uniref:type II secretion system protein GspL n=1 Tax=Alcanivorax sp. 24 TaxID=2545266 RepID=UPI001060BD26|nr:type II secretion system protein GspL [Alcanivorax sp. 24]